jgi:hypothetical protein
VDWVVLLTPLLVLSVVLLLGFAGCEFEHGYIPPKVDTLTFLVRVPTAVTVTRLSITWTPPGGTEATEDRQDPTPARTEGADNVFEHILSQVAEGMWTTSCRLRVREGTATADVTAPGDFPLSEAANETPVATWQAMGSPAAGTFAVTFLGAT